MLKKILPVIGGTVGFALGGPMGAAIGTGLGSAARGDNPSNVATNALMGFGLGSFGAAVGLQGGAGLGKLGTSAKSTFLPSATQKAAVQQGAIDSSKRLALEQRSLGQKALQFAKDNKLLTGALGLGALGAMGAFKEEDTSMPAPAQIEPGSQGMFDVSAPRATYYDTATGRYGASAPTLQPIARVAEGGFPRRTGQIDGPGTEKSDDIPAMLSDGEFVMTAAAVRGLGALNGADKDDKLEQRRKGAKMMYDMMDKFESKVA
tara:strand:- start:999 stop:1784 length:786 start_codon:yes stop_codon:yes gene_type:complete